MNIWEIIAGADMLLWLAAGALTIRAARKWGDVADVLLDEWEEREDEQSRTYQHPTEMVPENR